MACETLFLRNHTQNVAEKLKTLRFLKNQNWAYFLIDSLKFYTVCIIICQVDDYQNLLKLICRPLASFSAWFSRKNISIVIFH